MGGLLFRTISADSFSGVRNVFHLQIQNKKTSIRTPFLSLFQLLLVIQKLDKKVTISMLFINQYSARFIVKN